MILEKANRQGATAQSLAKTTHCMEFTLLPVGKPIVCKFSLRHPASLRLGGHELPVLGSLRMASYAPSRKHCSKFFE
jgi:hypothetical protein